jgi:hypothetical protein
MSDPRLGKLLLSGALALADSTRISHSSAPATANSIAIVH